jgi:hypothetical protein
MIMGRTFNVSRSAMASATRMPDGRLVDSERRDIAD